MLKESGTQGIVAATWQGVRYSQHTGVIRKLHHNPDAAIQDHQQRTGSEARLTQTRLCVDASSQAVHSPDKTEKATHDRHFLPLKLAASAL